MGFIQNIKDAFDTVGRIDSLIESHNTTSLEAKDFDYSKDQYWNDLNYNLAQLALPAEPVHRIWTDANNFQKRVRSLYFQCSVSRACVDKRAQGVSEISLIIKGSPAVEQLLTSPNPGDKTLANALRVWETSLSLGGDLYLFWDFRNPFKPNVWAFRQDLVVNDIKNSRYLYNPSRLSGTNKTPEFIFEYDGLGQTTRCQMWNGKNYTDIKGYLQRIAYFNPLSASEGAAPGDAALRSVDNWLRIQDLINSKMVGGGRKGGFLKMPMIRQGDKQVADFQAFMKQVSQENEYKAIVAGMDFVSNQLTFQELQLLEIRATEAASIQDAFKVPGVLLNSTTQTTYANMRAGDKIFYRTFIAPEAKWLIGQIEWAIKKYIDPNATVSVDETDISHIQDDQLQMAKDMSSTGCFTINEIRAVLGKDARPDGDVLAAKTSVGNGQPDEKPKGPVGFNADAGDRGDNNEQNQ